MHELETRCHVAPPAIETRADGKTVISGYAAVFYDGHSRSEYRLAEGVYERVLPGAFGEVLQRSEPVVALFNHDAAWVLGATANGTLALRVDEVGLHYTIVAPDTTMGRDVAAMVGRGDVRGSSFAFQVRGREGQHWRDEGQKQIRELRNVELRDVGPVTFPAYKGTTTETALRSLSEWKQRRPRSLRDRLALRLRVAKLR